MCAVKPTVVLVDDNYNALRTMEMLIHRDYPDIDVVSAINYNDAVDLIAKTKNIAVAFIDHNLKSDYSGSDLANRLRSEGRKFGIVIVSASEDVDRHYDYIQKPLSQSKIAEAISRYISMFSIKKDVKELGLGLSSILEHKRKSEAVLYG